jgi:hypothetical protein
MTLPDVLLMTSVRAAISAGTEPDGPCAFTAPATDRHWVRALTLRGTGTVARGWACPDGVPPPAASLNAASIVAQCVVAFIPKDADSLPPVEFLYASSALALKVALSPVAAPALPGPAVAPVYPAGFVQVV